MLKLIAGHSGTGGDEFGVDHRAVESLKAKPGEWLAAALDRRKHEVPSLREAVRTKAMSVGANVSTSEESSAFIDLLSPATVVLVVRRAT